MEHGLFGWSGQGDPLDLDVNTQLFTSSGVWSKPPNCEWVRVILIGGGGGGGGGSKRLGVNPATERPCGGSGGGGGGVSYIDIPAGILPNNVTVTIGAGGSAGVGATTDNGLGTAGGSGGTSSFGNILTATGGSGGTQGSGGGIPQAAGGNGLISGGLGSSHSFAVLTNSLRGTVTSGGGVAASCSDFRRITRVGTYPSHGTPFLEPQKYGVIGTGGQAGDFAFLSTSQNDAFPGTLGGGGGGGGGSVQSTTTRGGNGGAGGSGYCLISSYSSLAKPIDVQAFKSNGLWKKPQDARLSTVKVFAIGAGGGGGSGRRWSSSTGAYCTGSGLALSRTSGSYASALDAAPLDITGDIDIQAKVSLWNWRHGTLGQYTATLNTGPLDIALVSKWTETGNQRSYMLKVTESGLVYLLHSTDGTTVTTQAATDVLTFASNTTKWIRATLDVDNGSSQRVYKFYTSDDGSTWTQLGTTITASGATSIFNGTAPLNIGASNAGTSRLLDGNVYRAIIRNGYDGAGSVVFDADFSIQAAGTTSFTESSTNAATVTINSSTPNRTGGGGGNGGGVSYIELPLSVIPNTVDVTVGIGGVGALSATSDYTNGLNGTNGGDSSFGTYISAMGGWGGYGGNNYGGSSRIGFASGPAGNLTQGGYGGAGTGASAGTNSTATNTLTSGGGGGAGLATAGTTYAGGSSVAPSGYGSIMSTTTAGLSGTNLFNADGMFGSTGGGGGSSSASPSRDGGVGGRGSGGGGGAASNNGTNSGAGGNGGDGYVLVICT